MHKTSNIVCLICSSSFPFQFLHAPSWFGDGSGLPAGRQGLPREPSLKLPLFYLEKRSLSLFSFPMQIIHWKGVPWGRPRFFYLAFSANRSFQYLSASRSFTDLSSQYSFQCLSADSRVRRCASSKVLASGCANTNFDTTHPLLHG